jgi:hypothetical protein
MAFTLADNAAGDQRGNVRLLEAEDGRSLGLGKLPAFDNSTDYANKLGLEKLFFRIIKPRSLSKRTNGSRISSSACAARSRISGARNKAFHCA